jgi:hypothetical protein
MKDLYPKADVLAQRGHWDDATRDVIMDRVHNIPDYDYFDEHRRATLLALCDRVIPQGHRPSHKRVPIAPRIDQRCKERIVSGFRFDDMPPDEVAWERGLDGLDQTARAVFGGDFAQVDPAQQDQVLKRINNGDPPGEIWQSMPPKRWWIYIALRQISGIYYAHPYAWNEIGFGGPAYPRGYFALNNGAPEPWEPREVGTDGKKR